MTPRSDPHTEAQTLRERCIEWRAAQEANDRDDALIVEDALDRAVAAEARVTQLEEALREIARPGCYQREAIAIRALGVVADGGGGRDE